MRPTVRATAQRALRVAANLATLMLVLLLRASERVLFRFSRVGHTEVLDPAQFAWTRVLETHWREIRAELDVVLRYEDSLPNYLDLSDDAKGLTERENWKTFFFYAYGVRVPANCERCPRTAELLQEIDGLASAFFSVMRPGTRLRPHRGHYGGVLRYHLGLLVPDVESCGLRVGEHMLHWREGESVVFDDTFEHEAWNGSDGARVVLFVDFARPLPEPLASLNRLAIWLVGHSSVVQPGIARLRAWNQRFKARWESGAG